MSAQFGKISHDVTKFQGLYSLVVEEEHSGWDEPTIVDEEMKLLALKCEKAFKYKEIWNLIKNKPKWVSYLNKPNNKIEIAVGNLLFYFAVFYK